MFHIIQAQRSIRASCSTQCQCQCHWPLSATRWFFHRIYHRLPHSLRTECDVPVFCSKPLAYYHWSSKVWRQACSAGARTNYIVVRYTILENNLGYWHKALLLKNILIPLSSATFRTTVKVFSEAHDFTAKKVRDLLKYLQIARLFLSVLAIRSFRFSPAYRV